jgi:hypothetical protein
MEMSEQKWTKRTFPLAEEYRARRRYRSVRALPTGEFRAPQINEWYLSGAIVEAYQATCNLYTPFKIARLVRIIREERIEYV